MAQASASVVKLVVGVGSFALPSAFVKAGLLGGLVGLPVLAAMCMYCVWLLAQCKRHIGDRCSYYDIGRCGGLCGLQLARAPH